MICLEKVFMWLFWIPGLIFYIRILSMKREIRGSPCCGIRRFPAVLRLLFNREAYTQKKKSTRLSTSRAADRLFHLQTGQDIALMWRLLLPGEEGVRRTE